MVVLIIFHVILQTVVNGIMLSIGGQGTYFYEKSLYKYNLARQTDNFHHDNELSIQHIIYRLLFTQCLGKNLVT